MTQRRFLAIQAVRHAYATRKGIGRALDDPLCAIDVARECRVAVWFQALPSLEGMYATVGSGTIVLSSLRPLGRQAFTCAHELGHHILGHGERWDEYVADGRRHENQDEEWVADRFASYLLMPKRAVLRAFHARRWRPSEGDPSQTYTVACELGVSYDALVNQLRLSLDLIDASTHARLSRSTPRDIRKMLLGSPCPQHLVVVDACWTKRPVDLRVGHLVLLPINSSVEGSQLARIEAGPRGQLYQAVKPGVARAWCVDSEWASFVRVSRNAYVGHAEYRHLADRDDQGEDLPCS